MDDKNKYNNALEKLQEALAPKDGCEISGLTRNCIENIFPELKESKDERIREEIIATIHLYYGEPLEDEAKEMISWLEKQGKKTQGKSALEAVEEEKVGNANKVKPKFHEGEWLCENEPNNYARFIQILEIINVLGKERYRISRDIHNDEDIVECHFVEDNWHPFNIQDAKDGDVLYSLDSNQPFIYKERNMHGQATAYCGINKYGKFFVWNTKDCIITLDKYIPATKSQRDTLMNAMTKAGWQFDFEKKELKKVENEIEVPFSVKDSELKEENYYIPKGFYAEIDDDKVVIKKGKKPTAWSEEDEKNLRRAIWYVEHSAINVVKDTMLSEWLKSIKERVQPQPKQEWSEEDEKIALSIEQIMNCASLLNLVPEKIERVRTWLKSLKERIIQIE